MMKRNEKNYSGVIVPMITPLSSDYSIDRTAVALIMKTFTKNQCSAFVLGTTGESVSVAEKDKTILVESTVREAGHKIKVYAGISGNCLQESISNANHYASLGADAVVAHLPFYYPMNDSNMIRYFKTIADNIQCPLILYNNPITVKWSIPLEIIEELSYHPNIAGVKDSERGLERLDRSLALWSNRDDFSFLLGWTAQSAYALGKRCDGIVPSTANLTPQLYHDLYQSAVAGDAEKAGALQQQADIITNLYIKDRNISEAIPALKVLMAEYGLCKTVVLPPMYEADAQAQLKLRSLIRNILKESL
ncbi:MAG: dihydrodipicolinate synthase family protein [Bacteroidales bacterium]|nr:dihydrodipicolinate synthase family protein [Bacteroidales bacterium]MBN2761894.1 dihydrodipicolinate synthase family protein [Bacteroidales bacterium]